MKIIGNTIFSFFKRIWNWFSHILKQLWNLNWEGKIGVILLTPPVLSAIACLFNILANNDIIAFYDWVYHSSNYSGTPIIPIYLGLLAIAGAYLIKGNLL